MSFKLCFSSSARITRTMQKKISSALTLRKHGAAPTSTHVKCPSVFSSLRAATWWFPPSSSPTRRQTFWCGFSPRPRLEHCTYAVTLCYYIYLYKKGNAFSQCTNKMHTLKGVQVKQTVENLVMRVKIPCYTYAPIAVFH